MSLTIASLKYQDTKSSIQRYLRDNISWIVSATVIDGVSGKAVVGSINIDGTVLNDASCVLGANNSSLSGKEVELNYYNLSFPIDHCDLKRTWLSAFADKYRDEEDVYVDALIPFISEKANEEIRVKVFSTLLAEALIDTAVTKITLAGGLASGAAAYNTILEFISGFPTEFRKRVFDKHRRVNYEVNVSPEAFSLVGQHLGDKHGSYGMYIGGLVVVCDSTLTGNAMYCTAPKNVLIAFDSTEDLNKVKVIEKKYENKSYITSGIAFRGSYLDSSEIVISN